MSIVENSGELNKDIQYMTPLEYPYPEWKTTLNTEWKNNKQCAVTALALRTYKLLNL
jgi:hypothetical protein